MKTRSSWDGRRRRGWPAFLSVFLGAVILGGCGSDILYDVAYNSVTSTGRTLFDLWLTETINNILDAAGGGSDNDNGSGNGNQNGNGNDNTGNDNAGGGFDDLIGEVANGMALYSVNCASCHCPDASGGCLLDAPSVVSASAELIDEYVRGDASHPAKREWSDQEVVDVEAYLATFGPPADGNDNSGGGNDNSGGGGNDNTGGGGDAANGMALYSSGCAGCHCADASGHCVPGAPPLVDAPADLLDEYVRGDAPHPVKRVWSDQDILDVEAYLASLP